jgi:hypothetical protein
MDVRFKVFTAASMKMIAVIFRDMDVSLFRHVQITSGATQLLCKEYWVKVRQRETACAAQVGAPEPAPTAHKLKLHGVVHI